MIQEKINVLVVEDNLPMQQVIKQTFENAEQTDYTVCFAQTGVIAKQVLEDMATDIQKTGKSDQTLVLLDLLLPEDFGQPVKADVGLNLCSWIKQNPDLRHIPVIFFSNASEKEYRQKVTASYASDFIPKDGLDDKLFTAIDAVLFNQRATMEQFWDKANGSAEKQPFIFQHDPEAVPFIEKVDGLIRENISNPDFNREMLAQGMGCELRNFTTRLTETTGMGPATYISQCRVDYAVELLEKGIEPSKLPALCGCSAQTFRRIFKNFKNVTPKQYQKNAHAC